jgi:hypothetical protein
MGGWRTISYRNWSNTQVDPGVNSADEEKIMAKRTRTVVVEQRGFLTRTRVVNEGIGEPTVSSFLAIDSLTKPMADAALKVWDTHVDKIRGFNAAQKRWLKGRARGPVYTSVNEVADRLGTLFIPEAPGTTSAQGDWTDEY